MEERQIIWPTERIMANPKIFQAIADYFEGPEWDVFAGAFYDLMEGEIEEMDIPQFRGEMRGLGGFDQETGRYPLF